MTVTAPCRSGREQECAVARRGSHRLGVTTAADSNNSMSNITSSLMQPPNAVGAVSRGASAAHQSSVAQRTKSFEPDRLVHWVAEDLRVARMVWKSVRLHVRSELQQVLT